MEVVHFVSDAYDKITDSSEYQAYKSFQHSNKQVKNLRQAIIKTVQLIAQHEIDKVLKGDIKFRDKIIKTINYDKYKLQRDAIKLLENGEFVIDIIDKFLRMIINAPLTIFTYSLANPGVIENFAKEINKLDKDQPQKINELATKIRTGEYKFFNQKIEDYDEVDFRVLTPRSDKLGYLVNFFDYNVITAPVYESSPTGVLMIWYAFKLMRLNKLHDDYLQNEGEFKEPNAGMYYRYEINGPDLSMRLNRLKILSEAKEYISDVELLKLANVLNEMRLSRNLLNETNTAEMYGIRPLTKPGAYDRASERVERYIEELEDTTKETLIDKMYKQTRQDDFDKILFEIIKLLGNSYNTYVMDVKSKLRLPQRNPGSWENRNKSIDQSHKYLSLCFMFDVMTILEKIKSKGKLTEFKTALNPVKYQIKHADFVEGICDFLAGSDDSKIIKKIISNLIKKGDMKFEVNDKMLTWSGFLGDIAKLFNSFSEILSSGDTALLTNKTKFKPQLEKARKFTRGDVLRGMFRDAKSKIDLASSVIGKNSGELMTDFFKSIEEQDKIHDINLKFEQIFGRILATKNKTLIFSLLSQLNKSTMEFMVNYELDNIQDKYKEDTPKYNNARRKLKERYDADYSDLLLDPNEIEEKVIPVETIDDINYDIENDVIDAVSIDDIELEIAEDMSTEEISLDDLVLHVNSDIDNEAKYFREIEEGLRKCREEMEGLKKDFYDNGLNDIWDDVMKTDQERIQDIQKGFAEIDREMNDLEEEFRSNGLGDIWDDTIKKKGGYRGKYLKYKRRCTNLEALLVKNK